MSDAPRNEHDEKDRAPATGGGEPAQRPWSRRRFGQAVAASAPVLMTLHSRPLQADANCSVSGWVSGNTSLHHELEACGGRTPEYWASEDSKHDYPEWEKRHQQPSHAYPFHSINHKVKGRPASMQQCVDRQTRLDGVDGLGQQIVCLGAAALLNARYRRPPYPLNEERVRELVLLGLRGGGSTDRGDSLTAEQVKDFLENTMSGREDWG